MVELPGEIVDIQEEDEHVNLLVYGDSGVGKTVLGGSDDDVLFIAPEDNGTLSAKRFGSTAKKWKIHGWDDIVSAYEWLYTIQTTDPIPFNWVVLDSLTEMQDMCMRKILDEARAINPSRDRDVPLINDWQPYYNRFQRLVKAFNALPVNVLYTALQMEDSDEDEGDEEFKIVLPMMQGKGTQYAKKICGWMTSFGQMRVVRKQNGTNEDGTKRFDEYREIRWKGTRRVMAKDRTRCLEPVTIIGPGKLGGLKDIRELIEAGPQQPAATRIPPRKSSGKLRLRQEAEETAPNGNSDEVLDLMGVGE